MSLTNEDLDALKALFTPQLNKIDERLDKIDERLDKVDSRLDVLELLQKRTAKKLDDLQLDMKIAERDIRRDILKLSDEMETVIKVLQVHELLPQ